MHTWPLRALTVTIAVASAGSPAQAQRFPTPVQELSPAQPLELFGASLAVNGDTLAVGATNADATVPRCGVVYVFVRSAGTCVQEARLAPSDAETQGQFGSSMALRDCGIHGAARKASAFSQARR